MADIDMNAVRRMEESASRAVRAANLIEEAAQRISVQFEPGYGGSALLLIELLQAAQAEKAKPACTETIEWKEPDQSPGEDETILILLDTGDVVEGWFDGNRFANSFMDPFREDEVIAWAKWPTGART